MHHREQMLTTPPLLEQNTHVCTHLCIRLSVNTSVWKHGESLSFAPVSTSYWSKSYIVTLTGLYQRRIQ